MPGPVRAALLALALLAGAGACAAGEGADRTSLTRPQAPAPSTTVKAGPSTATSSTTTASTSTVPASSTGVVLSPDGLGVVAFGDPAEQVLGELSARLGRPSADAPVGACPSGGVDRLVEFAELSVLIGGGPADARFVAWDLGAPSGALPPLRTAEAVGVGTTLGELRDAYGSALEIRADDPFGPGFEVRVPPPGRLSGTLTGAGPGATVATLAGGAATCAE